MSTRRRRDKRKQHDISSIRDPRKSALQLQLETAIESPGGITKIVHLVQTATDQDVEELNTSQWTPIVGAIYRLGKNSTRNGNSAESEDRLMQVIRTCHERCIQINSGAWFGEHYHRPLIVAAYYGYPSAVRLLLELGALPDLGDGEGRNVWFAAFQNPVASSGVGTRRLRECDERTAWVLSDYGVVTNDLGVWRRTSPRGSLCYVNGDSSIGSVMLRALMNKNSDVVKFLRGAGGSLTDRDYLQLTRREVKSRLLPMVKTVLTSTNDDTSKAINKSQSQVIHSLESWSEEIDWSFPPTWKVGVVLCQNCGLPPDIFRSFVVPFLDRNCFFTSSDNQRQPSLLGPSLGERVGLCRQKQWMKI